MAVNASWPGRVEEDDAPAVLVDLARADVLGDAAALAGGDASIERIASSRLVLPWSTWPMTVTIGGRGWSSVAIVLLEEDFLGRLRAWRVAVLGSRAAARAWRPRRPRSPARWSRALAVSRSSGWLMLAKMPLLISSRMTSAALTPRSSASSLTSDRVRDLDRAARGRLERLDRRLGLALIAVVAVACAGRACCACRSYCGPCAVPPPALSAALPRSSSSLELGGQLALTEHVRLTSS